MVKEIKKRLIILGEAFMGDGVLSIQDREVTFKSDAMGPF